MSFFNWGLMAGEIQFVGLKNYFYMSHRDRFVNAMLFTTAYMFSAIGLSFPVALGAAILLQHESIIARILRTLILLPMMFAMIIVAIAWRWLFHYQFGIINYLLSIFGLPRIAFLSEILTARFVVMFVGSMWHIPFTFALLLSALYSIPKEVRDAAKIDCTSKVQEYIHIMFPYLKPIILVCILLNLIEAAKLFETVYAVTYGGPANSTESLSFLAYRVSFQYLRLGEGAAISWWLFLIVAIISLFLLNLTRRG